MESEFEDMSVRDGMALINKINKFPMYNITPRTRQNMVMFLEQVMDNCVPGKDDIEVKHRLKAVEIMLSATAQNLAAEKLQIDLLRGDGATNQEQPKMVLLLPPNNTEVVEKAAD